MAISEVEMSTAPVLIKESDILEANIAERKLPVAKLKCIITIGSDSDSLL